MLSGIVSFHDEYASYTVSTLRFFGESGGGGGVHVGYLSHLEFCLFAMIESVIVAVPIEPLCKLLGVCGVSLLPRLHART